MPSTRTTKPSSKPSRTNSPARQSANAILTPRALSPSPLGSSPVSADGPATTASPVPRSCDEACKTSAPSNTELLWGFTMCESDSRGGGEGLEAASEKGLGDVDGGALLEGGEVLLEPASGGAAAELFQVEQEIKIGVELAGDAELLHLRLGLDHVHMH